MNKWRPSLRSIIFVMLAIVLMLPLAGLFFFRIYENQLVRQTENELIAQAAVMSSVFADKVREAAIPAQQLGPLVSPRSDGGQRYHPVEAVLDLTSSNIGPRRPDGVSAPTPAIPSYQSIGQSLEPLLERTKDITLAGFRLLDPQGIVIAGGDEIGLSLSHVDEVTIALKGSVSSVLRQRVSDEPPPPLYSISRGTKVRVFVAYPVLVDNHIAGIVYASRTPSNIVKQLYIERKKVVLALLSILSGTLLLGYLASRTLTGPIRELTDRTRRIIAGDRDALHPLSHHGSREMAELSQGLLTMAQKLRDRSDQVSTFATHVSHELKSPLTSIQGAAELLRDTDMSEAQRDKFLTNIIGDTSRLNLLVKRLLDLARATSLAPQIGVTNIQQAIAEWGGKEGLEIITQHDAAISLAISPQNLGAILANLASNAMQNGATQLIMMTRIEGRNGVIKIADNGSGISSGNANKIFDPFFTTRRDAGGTGMGLGIVKAMLETHGGSISLAQNETSSSGAIFLLTLPLE